MRHRSKRKWHRLDLLCRAGLSIETMAPAVCRTLRDLVGADAASLFWLDEKGMPAGIFHENAAESALDLFVNEYDRLFTGVSEINVSQIASKHGAPAGHLLNPGQTYFNSNTFNLLVRASGHWHTLDLRVDVANRARAVVMLFRERQVPFREADAFYLTQALTYLRRAVERQSAEGPWTRTDASGHLLVDPEGTKVLTVSEGASRLLKGCTVVGQNVRLTGPTTLAPRFARDLCRRLQASSAAAVELLEIPTGRLRITASQMRSPLGDSPPQVLISLEMERPTRLGIIENLLDIAMSPLQRSIALFAALGGSRTAALKSTGVSNEALKKHLAAIYRAVGVNSWEELTTALR